MKSKKKRFWNKKWTKYAFEFISIFIAVVSAFTLSNWNDNRRSNNAESRILVEINNGLEKDLVDLITNQNGHKRGLRSAEYFTRVIAGQPVNEDSLFFHYNSLTRDFISVQNTSGYETLKSRGLELIENDSLRTKIISLYEYDYNTLRKLEEEYYELQFHKNYFKDINRMFARNFIFDEKQTIVGIVNPLEIMEVDRNTLLVYLIKIKTNREFILRYYSDVSEKISQTKNLIENIIE